MKKVLFLLTLCATALGANATVFTYTPNPADLYDLDHSAAYSWGINDSALRNALTGGQKITSAKLTITNIWDWTVESNDILYIDLLNNPSLGVTKFTDNEAYGDYFKTRGGQALTTWTDPVGGKSTHFNFLYNFSANDINVLTSYIKDTTAANKAIFGLSFDPDCHYYNDGVRFEIVTSPANVPDGAATVSLLGLGLIAIAAIRRFIRA